LYFVFFNSTQKQTKQFILQTLILM